MASAYPSTLPSFTTKRDNTDVNWAADINRLQDEISAMATELGTVPKANFSNVAVRLQHLQASKSDVGHHHDERYISRFLATTKGTLVVSTGNASFIGTTASSSGQVLMSDEAQITGMRWTTMRHDSLPGLANDDHPQYHTTPRHNALDHTPVVSQLSVRVLADISNTPPETGQVLKWDGGQYRPMAESFVSSHGGLAGLDADDHPHYLNQSRHHSRSLHDAIGITHGSLTGLTSGNPHTQYPMKSGTESVSGQWTFTTRPRVNSENVMSHADGGRKVFVRTSSPTGHATGDIWFRP